MGEHQTFSGEASQEKPPRDAVHQVIMKNLGGISSCEGIGQLPQNRQQSSDLKRKRTDKNTFGQRKTMFGKAKVGDPWYLLLKASKQR